MKRTEQVQAMVRQRKDNSEIERNPNTLNDGQTALLRKSAKQLFTDGVDQLTTNQAGHVDVAELYNGRRLVREALKLVKQLVDTIGFFV